MSAVVHITDADFQKEVLDSPILTVVDFWAEWCTPCRRMAPILDEIAAEHPDRIRIAKLDVDSNPATPGRYDVSGIPTLLVFRAGEMLDAIVGFLPKDRLLAKLEPHLEKVPDSPAAVAGSAPTPRHSAPTLA